MRHIVSLHLLKKPWHAERVILVFLAPCLCVASAELVALRIPWPKAYERFVANRLFWWHPCVPCLIHKTKRAFKSQFWDCGNSVRLHCGNSARLYVLGSDVTTHVQKCSTTQSNVMHDVSRVTKHAATSDSHIMQGGSRQVNARSKPAKEQVSEGLAPSLQRITIIMHGAIRIGSLRLCACSALALSRRACLAL